MKFKDWHNIMTSEALQSLAAVGRLIQLARKRRKMSMAELGNRVSVDRRTIAQLEAGNPGVSLGVLIQTLSVLGLSHGLEVALSPDNDLEAIAQAVRKIRQGGKEQRKISDEEVNF